MSGILSRIVAAKKVQLAGRKASLPESELEKLALESPISPYPLREALRRPAGQPIRVLAECKKASPSKGVMIEDYDPLKLARAYLAGGASGISVLTETEFFLGADEHLRAVVQAIPLPILRKDFTIERYQLLEARCLGASAILLIAACLDDSLMRELSLQARELGLDVLVEIHHPRELDPALEAEPTILGINNRDLDTFRVSLDTTFSLLPHLPADIVTISESGISSRLETDALEQAGVDAILCGEGVGTSADPESKVRELRGLA